MKQAAVTIKYDEEKLNAIRQYMKKKEVNFDSEMNDVLDRLYEKYVPQAVREYIDSRTEVPAVTVKKGGNAPAKSTRMPDHASFQNK